MKKLIFSAIAMIAFAGSSMANTEEVKAKEETVEGRDCRAEQAATVKYAKEVMGMNDKDANAAGYSMFFSCKSDTVKEMSFSIQQTN